jgi:hypothetical protein
MRALIIAFIFWKRYKMRLNILRRPPCNLKLLVRNDS